MSYLSPMRFHISAWRGALPGRPPRNSLAPARSAPGPPKAASPSGPRPRITEYKPRSTLVVPEHMVPRAKFPAVDFHGHPPNLADPKLLEEVGEAMDSLNLQLMVSANNTSGDRLQQQLAAVEKSKYKGRFVFLTGLDLRNVGPGSGQKIAAQLEADIKAGAVGVGEIPK